MIYIPNFHNISPFLPLVFVEFAIGMGWIHTRWLKIILRIFYIVVLVLSFIEWQISKFFS